MTLTNFDYLYWYKLKLAEHLGSIRIYLLTDWLNDEITRVSSTLGDKNTWVLERSRRLYGRRPFDYAALTKDGSAIIVAAEAGFVFDFDSLKPVREEEPMETALNQQGSFCLKIV